jgi:hypothetical protein
MTDKYTVEQVWAVWDDKEDGSDEFMGFFHSPAEACEKLGEMGDDVVERTIVRQEAVRAWSSKDYGKASDFPF